MPRTSFRRPARAGFTLVELLVSAAVCVIIMVVLSVAFQTGLDAMRQVKSQGDMTDHLRAAGVVLKRDLQAEHFLPTEGSVGVQSGTRGTRLSDYRFDLPAGPAATSTTVRGGFVWMNSPTSTNEGNDGAFDSTRSDAHVLWLTSVLSGGTEGDLYTATYFAGGAPQIASSEAAEVAYFLGSPAGIGQATGSTGSVPYYNLYRRQRLVARTDTTQALLQAAVNADPSAQEVISTTTVAGAPRANTLADVARTPAGPRIPGPLTSRVGDDVLLSNVISFEVKPTWVHRNQNTYPATNPASQNNAPVPFAGRAAFAGPPAYPAYLSNTDAPFDNLAVAAYPGPQAVFDTTIGPSLPIRVNAIQLRLRVFDTKLKSARQVTFVIEL